MKHLITWLMSMLLLWGCYKSVGSKDDGSEAGVAGIDTSSSGDADTDVDSNSDTDTDTDVDTGTFPDTDTDTDTDTDSDTDTDIDADIDIDGDSDTDCFLSGGFTDCLGSKSDIKDLLRECWWLDAIDDGVTCETDSDCIGENHCVEIQNGWKVCSCTSIEDCKDGLCVIDKGICGPSRCNNFYNITCFSGCKPSESYELCPEDSICLEENYPYCALVFEKRCVPRP